MSIFNRSKDPGRHQRAGASRGTEDVTDPVAETASADDADETGSGTSAAAARTAGPWDVSEVDGRDGRVDLGALWMRGVQGMELRLEVDQESQQVSAATAVLGDSALQVQAFAAPRSAGLWDEIRSEIAVAVEGQGGTAEEHEGDLGTHLRTRMPSAGPDGRTVFAPATFIGVDGPRWFLRGVLSGRAAIDDDAAAPLIGVFREAVVVRGGDPMAPRELLPLSLPRDVGHAHDQPSAEEETQSLDPFERGPEITEVR